MIDSSWHIQDNYGTQVNFGDTLIGRINYQIQLGNLVKIKTNPSICYAYVIGSDGRERKFDINIDEKQKLAVIDAWSAKTLMSKQEIFTQNNPIIPIFEGYEDKTTLVKVKPTEAFFDLIVKRVTDCLNKPCYGYYDLDFNITFNKKQYHFGIDLRYDYSIKIGNNYKIVKAELSYSTSKLEVEGVRVATHPKIIQLLKDIVK